MMLPYAHCMFVGCNWCADWRASNDNPDSLLQIHLNDKHWESMGLLEEHRDDVMAYYCAAVAERERERMPLIGPSVDRRTLALLQRVYNSDAVKSLVCFVCGQIHTFLKHEPHFWQIRYDTGALFDEMQGKDLKVLELNCGLREFQKRYARGGKDEGNVFFDAGEFQETSWEWKRSFVWSNKNRTRLSSKIGWRFASRISHPYQSSI